MKLLHRSVVCVCVCVSLMFFYVCLQKDGLGFDRAVEECKARMSRYSVTVRLPATNTIAELLQMSKGSRLHCVLMLAAEHAHHPAAGK